MTNKIVLTFAGDSRPIERTFDRIGEASRRFSKDVDKDSDRVLDSFGKLGKSAAGGFVSSFGDKIAPMLSNLPVSGPLAAAFAAAAPIVGAALSSGILLAVGGGVLAGGIALIAKDPKITSALKGLRDRFLDKDLGEDKDNIEKAEQTLETAYARLEKARALGQDKAIKSALYDIEVAKKKLKEAQKGLADSMVFNKKNISLRDAAKPFIEPTKRALERFTESADKVIPSFARMADAMAPAIDKLSPAFAEMVERSLPGLEKAVTASLPLFDKLAEHLPKIGDAISGFFETVSGDTEGSTRVLDLFLTLIEHSITLIGVFIRAMTETFNAGWNAWNATLRGLGDAWDWVSKKAGASAKWISDKWSGLVSFFRGVPGALGRALSSVGDAIYRPFRSAFNAISRAWNNTVGRLSWSIPTWIPGIGGNSISAPRLPTFHKGGIMPGAPGQEGLALLQAGERITPPGRGGDRTVIEIRSGGSRLDDLLVEILRDAIRVRGGNVQLALGAGRG